MKPVYSYLVISALSLMASCAESDSGISDKKLESDIALVSGKIDELTADLSCDTNDQCLSIEYGHKPCGGPAAFKIYSSKNTDVTLIGEYADDYFRLTMEFNERHGLTSDCSVEMPPALQCDGECKPL